MIRRIRRRLIIHQHRLPNRPRKVTLEPQIRDLRNLLIALALIILNKQSDASNVVEQCSLHGKLDGFVRGGGGRCEWDFEGLDGLQVGTGAEVEVVAVDVELDGTGGGLEGGGVDED